MVVHIAHVAFSLFEPENVFLDFKVLTMPAQCDMIVGDDHHGCVDDACGRRDPGKTICISQSKVMEAFGGKSF